MKNIQPILCTFVVSLCCSCSVNKFIPQDRYLLDEVTILSDEKVVKPSEFVPYLRQNANTKWFNLVKVPMHIYSLSGRDSAMWLNRFLRKAGDEPVIYDPVLARKSCEQIQKAVQNKGYMGAKVTMDTVVNKKKLKLNYRIETGKLYTVNHLAYNIDDLTINQHIMADTVNSLLHEGMPFDVNVLDAERQRIAKRLLNNGYYKFNKDFIVYQADTVRNTYRIDLTMKLLPYQRRKEDQPTAHKQFKIRNVNFLSQDNIHRISKLGTDFQLEERDGLRFYYEDKHYVRPSVLSNFNYITPNSLYNESDVQRTYTSLGRLRAYKYSNIQLKEVKENDSIQLDANVLLAKAKNKSLAFEIEGTNSAGDLGAAASLTFQHRNVFRGSEIFTFKVRGAYESITGLEEGYESDDYKEYGFESSLNFPEFKFPFLSKEFKRKIRATSEVGAKFNSQLRPEFIRTLASASWSYRWTGKKNGQHRFDMLNVNYVYVPWKSEAFKKYLANLSDINSILTKSYEDQLIVHLAYSFVYNSAGKDVQKRINRNSYSLRVNLEESGNLLYACSKLVNSTPKADKGFVIANIPFAQYVKGDFDFTKNFYIDPKNSFAFHIGFGIAYPYGNSKILPFEKRYFSGGPNSVRGWSVRSLGPGNYRGKEETLNYIDHTGDIKLDLNVEYRTHLFWKLHGAAFVDAGNIWNIYNYDGQEEGTFRFNKFYEQLAVAYGLGIRFDLDFLILRFDGGMKAVNPMKTGKDRYPLIRPDFGRDFAFHFAVGYPF